MLVHVLCTNTFALWDREMETIALIHSSFYLLLSDADDAIMVQLHEGDHLKTSRESK